MEIVRGKLYACNSGERDEMIFLSRPVRFELVMTQNFKPWCASTGAFFRVNLRCTQSRSRVVKLRKHSCDDLPLMMLWTAPATGIEVPNCGCC
jgi:hypothetical protein